jgi:hypothetical protein
MVAFLGGGAPKCRARCLGTGRERLPVVKALGGDLAGMIDPHEPGGMPAAARIDGQRRRISRCRAACGRACEAPAQASVGEFQQPVEG